MDFIYKIRQKNNMAPYMHHRIPKIEKYANQLQWVKNTLEDRNNIEFVVENTLIDLEKQLDEDSFLHVIGESSYPDQSDILEKPHEPEGSSVPDLL